MILLHCAAIHWQQISGPAVSVPGLVTALGRVPGVRVALATTLADAGRPPQTAFPLFDRDALLRGTEALGLPVPFDRPNLVVFHSTYIPAHAALARRLRAAGIPYIICPRNGMSQRAQNYRRWKKWLGNWLFFDRLVAGASALHCLTRGEAEQVRRWDIARFVVGNGTAMPEAGLLASPGSRSELQCTFVGRLAVDIKGLDLLLDAWNLLRFSRPDLRPRLAIHGPDCRGGEAWLRERVASLGLGDRVTIGGAVTGRAKSELLRQSDLFLHTSRFEGHPMAVLEALAHGLPCLLTEATNVADEVAAAAAGWRAQTSAEGIAAALEAAMTAPPAELAAMGRRARQLVAEHYDWPRIAEKTVTAYRQYAA